MDTLLEPEFDRRYFDFNGAWNVGERLFSMRSGEGDHAFAWFGAAGALVRGKQKGKKAVPDQKLFEGLPRSFDAVRREAAFQLGGDSFASWAPKGKATWQSGKDPMKGGLADLLGVLLGDPKGFARYAKDHHDVRLDPAALALLFEGTPVSLAAIRALSVTIDPAPALALAKELGLETRGQVPKARTRSPAKPKAASRSKRDQGEPLGDAEFKVVGRGDETLLVVGGKIQLKATGKDLYYAIIEQIRATLRAAGAK